MKGDRRRTWMITYSFCYWSADMKTTFSFRSNQTGDSLYKEILGRTKYEIRGRYLYRMLRKEVEFSILNATDLGY